MAIAERVSTKERIRTSTQRIYGTVSDLKDRIDEVLTPKSLTPLTSDGQAANVIFMGRFDDALKEAAEIARQARKKQQEAASAEAEKKRKIKEAKEKIRKASETSPKKTKKKKN